MQKITPFLWFDGRAEEAANFYTSIFKNSKITTMKKWGDGSPFPKDQVMTGILELDGETFYAFDAGPMFKFTEAISMFVDCADQVEVDYFWDKLTSGGGEESQCGWLKDKFGLSWQIVPREMMEMISSSDKAAAGRAMQEMMTMKKIDLARIKKAFKGEKAVV